MRSCKAANQRKNPIAVLPSSNSEKKDHGYFSDGLSEETDQFRLGKSRTYGGHARTSLNFRGTQAPSRNRLDLGVANGSMGSVRRRGQTRFGHRAADRADRGLPLWSQS